MASNSKGGASPRGAGRLFRRGKVWWLDYSDHRGERARRAGSTDRGVAKVMLGEALASVEKMKAGIIRADPREARRALTDHLTDYLAELERVGRDKMYRYNIERRIKGAAQVKGWTTLLDCDPKSLSAYLASLAAEGLKPKTVNDHRADLSAFFGWCVKRGRLEANPCAAVEKVENKAEKTRRALSVLECTELLKVAPPRRRLVYATLIYTGLRRAEADALRWVNVRLDGMNPHIDLPAAITKSSKAERIPLVPSLAAMLREARGDAAPGSKVFRAIPKMETFRKDLETAKIDEKDERGRIAVLHSLRHSTATMLMQSGVAPALAMKIMRHRHERLTTETYTDEALLPLDAAAQMMPDMLSGFALTAAARAVAATGTDGRPGSSVRPSGVISAGPKSASGTAGTTVPDFVPFGGHKVASEGARGASRRSGRRAQTVVPSASGVWVRPSKTSEKAGDLGFEPRLTEPESVVLPLHQSPNWRR